ncbi:MAG TPA: Uma2 family endonuclease [Gemmatirosa sp.]
MTARAFIDDPNIPEWSELVDGVVVPCFARPLNAPPRAHNRVARAIFRALDAHVAPRRLGEVYFDGTSYELPPRDDVVRLPDVSFVRAGREPAEVERRGIPRLAPDLVVEVLSESDQPAVIGRKRAHYFGGGTSLLWLIDIEARGVEVWTPAGAPTWVAEDAQLDGGAVLPGFAVPVRDLFAGVAREA